MSRDSDPTVEFQPLDAQDAAILASLREVLDRLDPVPAGLGDQVRFALTVQALEAEIAELQLSPAEPMEVRAVDYSRAQTVTFTAEHLTTMVTMTPLDSGHVRIDGWVTGGEVEVELRERSRSTSVTPDDSGRFVFERVERGMVQFLLTPIDAPPGTRPVITPSFEL